RRQLRHPRGHHRDGRQPLAGAGDRRPAQDPQAGAPADAAGAGPAGAEPVGAPGRVRRPEGARQRRRRRRHAHPPAAPARGAAHPGQEPPTEILNMTPPEWIQRGVSLLKPSEKNADAAARPARAPAAKKPAADTRAPRTLAERLEATLRRHGEAMAPRTLRKALEDLQAVVDPRVSEVEAGRRAHDIALW